MDIVIPSRLGSVMKVRHGLLVKRPQQGRVWHIPERAKRGKITSFSRASSLNMKRKLLTLPSVTGLWGITLTIKKSLYNGDPESVRLFWNRFNFNLKNRCKRGLITLDCHFIWRIELQKNKTPHWHILFHGAQFEDVLQFKDCYLRQLKLFFNYDAPDDGIAVNIRFCDTSEKALEYISSHATKHKRDQLGWQGRQWGIVFVSKEGKERYKEDMRELYGCEKVNDIGIEGMSVAESKLCNIDGRVSWKLFKRTLRKFIERNMVGKKIRGVRLKKHWHISLDYSDLEFFTRHECGFKWLAQRRSSQSCHFLTNSQTSAFVRLAKVVNQ